MREIKFRGKRIDNNEWVYGSYVYEEGWHYIVVTEYLGDGCSVCGCPCVKWHLVDAETVGQYNGLKDKNGKEVYEGDIVNCSRGCPHEVYFEDEYGGTYVGGMPAFYLKGLLTGYAWTGSEEIIGNIHENPELLGVRE